MNNFSFKAYILLALMVCVSVDAWADIDITVTFSEGDLPKLERLAGTGILPDTAVLFNDVTVTVDTTISGCLIVPGRGTRTYIDSLNGNKTEDLVDFYGCVVDNGGGTLKLSGRNRLDSETYYFRKDYQAKGQDTLTADLANRVDTLWAYTFTGWYIKNSTPLVALQYNPTHVPAQTVFQPGDVITPDILALNDVITRDTLELIALWGKCCFVSHEGKWSNLGNDRNSPCTLDSVAPYTTRIANRFCNYDAYMQVAMLVDNDTIQGPYNESYYGITYKSLQTTDGKTYELYKKHYSDTYTYISRGNTRIDNVYMKYNYRQTMASLNPYGETTARLSCNDYQYIFFTYTSEQTYNHVFVANGGMFFRGPSYVNYQNNYYYIGRKSNLQYCYVYMYGIKDVNVFFTGGKSSVLGVPRVTGSSINAYCYGNLQGTSDKVEYDPDIYIRMCLSSGELLRSSNLYINGCSRLSSIYGGGIEYITKVEDVNLQIYNSRLSGDVYVGGQYGTVTGKAKAIIKNTTIDRNVYGCASGATSSQTWYPSLFDMKCDSLHAPTGFPQQITAEKDGFPPYSVFSVLYNYIDPRNGDYNIPVSVFSSFGVSYYLSLAQAGSVDIELENCTIGQARYKGHKSYGNIYGGGAIAQVLGNVSIKLKDCTVYSNVYGGGDGITTPATFIVEFPVDSLIATYIPPSSIEMFQKKRRSYQHPCHYYPDDSTYTADSVDFVTDQFGERRRYGTRKYQWSFDPALLAMGGFDHANKLAYSPNGGGWGDVQGSTNVSITGGTVHGSVYGGGNAGRVGYSGVDTNTGGGTTLSIDSTTVKGDVYGGCNQANVGGDIRLTVSPGTEIQGTVYSGNNTSGTIAGNVTSIISTNTTTVYGGGKGAKTNVGGKVDLTLAGNTISGDVYAGSAYGNVNATYDADSVLVATSDATTKVTLNGSTVKGNVYGGGLGQQDDPSTTDKDESIEAKVFGPVTVQFNNSQASNVFGCNNLNGAPQSTVTVNIAGGTVTDNVYGGGNLAAYKAPAATPNYPLVTISGGTMRNVFGGGNEAGITGSPVINFNGGKDSIGIYGGCNVQGTVTGDATVNINGGTVGTSETHANGIFGGGYGQNTLVGGSVYVNVNDTTSAKSLAVYGDVYGGSALGNTNATISGSDTTATAGAKTQVTLSSGSVTGNIYGGGLGSKKGVNGDTADVEAKVYGPVTVALNGGTVHGNAFGGNNLNGAPQSTDSVRVDSIYPGAKYYGNIYGGGNQAAYTGSPVVTVSGGTVSTYTENDSIKGGNVFGGGLGATAVVKGDPQVLVSGGTVTGTVYGGGDEANVQGGTTVKVTGADTKVNGSVFGGGNNAAVSGTTNVQVGGN